MVIPARKRTGSSERGLIIICIDTHESQVSVGAYTTALRPEPPHGLASTR